MLMGHVISQAAATGHSMDIALIESPRVTGGIGKMLLIGHGKVMRTGEIFLRTHI